MLMHEDYPHTVPARAYLRWKENYFWIFMDRERDVFVHVHMSMEPINDRAVVSFAVLHAGELVKNTTPKVVPMPRPFEHQREMSIGPVGVKFLKPQAAFQLVLDEEAVQVTLDLERRMDLFDFHACSDVEPDKMTLSRNVSFAHADFRHQGQSIKGHGRVTFRTGRLAGQTIDVQGTGYRDHSWGLRNDQLTVKHSWNVLNFPDQVFHIYSFTNKFYQFNPAQEGYVGAADGNQVLINISIEAEGEGQDDMPSVLRLRATTLDGKRYNLICDVGNSFARLPLVTQASAGTEYYMAENMCVCRNEDDGTEGLANIEIGWIREIKAV